MSKNTRNRSLTTTGVFCFIGGTREGDNSYPLFVSVKVNIW